jgi:hypothetical protein
MGQTDIRRLLIVGAMRVIRWGVRRGGSTNRWLAALVARKSKMVAAVRTGEQDGTYGLANDHETGKLPDGVLQARAGSGHKMAARPG